MTEHLPLMNPASFISQCNRYSTILTEVKEVAIVMVVRADPANPYTGGILTSKHPD